MGYKRKIKTFTLAFDSKEDEELDGLEVKMKGLSIKAYLRIADLATVAAGDGAEQADIAPLLKGFSEALISWNLEGDDDEPVGTDYDSVCELELEFVMLIINHWLKAAAGVPAPLEGSSNSGETSLEATMNMASL